MSAGSVVLVLGASTAAGQYFLEEAAEVSDLQLIAISRHPPSTAKAGVTWLQHDLSNSPVSVHPVVLVSFGPVGLALRQLAATTSVGRVIALSSASTRFKSDSSDPAERALMAQIESDERDLADLCRQRGASLDLFKTTMIYGGDSDQNVSRLKALIASLPLVPVVGNGLRAPVHAEDLARLALRVVPQGTVHSRSWLLEGGERLTYPNLLKAIAGAQGQSVRIMPMPLWLMRAAIALAHRLGRLRDVNAAMLARQADDLVVDDSPARAQLGWNPRRFSP